jgi:hypothetical protein
VLPAVLALVLLGGALVLVRHRQPDAQGDAREVLRRMESILDSRGLAAALDSLGSRAQRDTALQREGHQIAHALGRRAVERHRGDVAVIGECRPVFASGCYHGVVEASLHAAGRIDVPALERLCVSAAGPERPAPAFECIHGLGHGILDARGYDVEATLRDCDALSTARRAASCHAGAFMEAINAGVGAPAMHGTHQHTQGHGARPPRLPVIDTTDPYSPCQAYGDPYATSCWLFQGFLILRATDFDPGRALRVCDGAPDGRAGRCYESVGHQLTGLLQKGDQWILEQCARGQPALAPHCAGGATLALNAMDWTGSRAAGLCAGAPEDWKETCYRTASDALVDLASPTRRAQLCASVEPGYAEVCRVSGLLVTPSASPGSESRPPDTPRPVGAPSTAGSW